MWTWVPCHVVLIATILCYIFIKCRESCCYTVVAFLYDNLNSLNIRNNYFILFYYQLCVDIFCQDEKGIWNNKSVLILLEYIIIQLMRKNIANNLHIMINTTLKTEQYELQEQTNIIYSAF